jgi:DNA replication and repair protein RecF
MPRLEKINIADFRNIALDEIEFSPNVNCIVGGNGEGKTNLLDAIYYLSMAKSFLGQADRYNIRHGEHHFAICGQYSMESGLQSKISLQVSPEEKILKKDGKNYSKISAHIGQFPIVTVSPTDSALVSESGEERRRFVNIVLSQMDASYLSALQQYNKVLQQRNHLLKEDHADFSLLDVLDWQLSQHAAVIFEKRREWTEKLSPIVAGYYSRLSADKEQVSIQYQSELHEMEMADLLLKYRDRDRLLKYTCCGIQRDDFIFNMKQAPIRRCGSQGQQKTFLVALKFAQYELMKQSIGIPPTLLLDDVFDKLDISRTAQLISMVAQEDFGQIFITDCNQSRIRSLVDQATADRAYFEAEGGRFKSL